MIIQEQNLSCEKDSKTFCYSHPSPPHLLRESLEKQLYYLLY